MAGRPWTTTGEDEYSRRRGDEEHSSGVSAGEEEALPGKLGLCTGEEEALQGRLGLCAGELAQASGHGGARARPSGGMVTGAFGSGSGWGWDWEERMIDREMVFIGAFRSFLIVLG